MAEDLSGDDEGARPGEAASGDPSGRRAGEPRRALLRHLVEELSRPRARLRRALRHARDAVRSSPLSSAAVFALLAGVLILLYATGVGAARGAAAAGAFLGAFLALVLGGPLVLIYAWPAVVAGAAGLLLWGVLALGAGAAWLWVATVSAFMIVYFASVEMAPLVGAAGLAGLASELGRSPAIAVFVLALGLFYWARRRLSASILAAAWTALAASAAAQVAWVVLDHICRQTGGRVPPEWGRGMLPGPVGLLLWVVATALVAARLVWSRPRDRETAPAAIE